MSAAIDVDPEHPITGEIARFVVEAPPRLGSGELGHLVERALIDTLAVAIAGRNEECVRILHGTVHGESRGGATVWTGGAKLPEGDAALLNGTAVHALDFDDVTDPLYGHPSAALFPALVALAEVEGATGAELADAYVIGFQVLCAVADGLPIRAHYSRGWHSTATVGVLGATAACCRLLRLPEDSVRRALAIAASMASGSRQNFGTMTKPLHVGLTGRSALLAARLASNGFTADASQLEAQLGYFAMFGTHSDLGVVSKTLGERWALETRGLNVKKYPCCYNTHRTADAALSLAPNVARLGRPTAIRLTLEPGGFDPLIHHRPRTGLEAKFSAEYVVAACLVDQELTLSSFLEDEVRRPEILDLEEKMVVGEDRHPPFGDDRYEFAYSALEVEAGGEILRERVDVPRGSAERPLSDAELEAKFRDCLVTSDSAVPADELWHGLNNFRHVAVAEAVGALSAQPA